MPGHVDMIFDTPKARAAASRLRVSERQRIIKFLRVPYHTYNRGLAMIARLHRPVVGGLSNLGAVGGHMGEPGAGKTIISEACAELYSAREGEMGDGLSRSLYQRVARDVSPTAGNKVQRAMASPHRIMRREDPTDWSVDRVLKCRTELLILDDSQFRRRSPELQLHGPHRLKWSRITKISLS